MFSCLIVTVRDFAVGVRIAAEKFSLVLMEEESHAMDQGVRVDASACRAAKVSEPLVRTSSSVVAARGCYGVSRRSLLALYWRP